MEVACTSELLAALECIALPLSAGSDHILQDYVMRILHNLAVNDKRRTGVFDFFFFGGGQSTIIVLCFVMLPRSI